MDQSVTSNGSNDCDHGNLFNFKCINLASYYTDSYILKHNHPVTICNDCKVLFGKHYKVSQTNPVYVCSNAENSKHKCVFAFCNNCYNKLLLSNSGNKGKRRSNTDTMLKTSSILKKPENEIQGKNSLHLFI